MALHHNIGAGGNGAILTSNGTDTGYTYVNPTHGVTFHGHEQNTITCLAGGEEMLKVGPDGFWVRGVKVEQDANEAKAVYEAFKQWMAWASLNRDYK